MKSKKTFCVLVLSILFGLDNVFAQNTFFPFPIFINNGVKPPPRQVQEGTIQLKSGQVITGRFKYDHWEFPVKNFAFYKDAHAKSKRVKFRNIQAVTFVGSDTSVTFRKDSTEFVGIKGRLYRKIADGRIKIYDRVIRVKEWQGRIGQGIYVESKGKLKRIESIRRFNKWYQGLSETYPNLKIRNEYLNKIEIIREIQKYNVLKE